MIVQELSKLKRRLIMSTIELMVFGILMIICPEKYIVTMIGAIGAVLMIMAMLGVLEYLGSDKNLMNYISLTVALILGIIGTVIQVFEVHSFVAISNLFGIFLILSGIGILLNARAQMKRTQHRHWQVMCVLALIMVACGLILFVHPWWNTHVVLFNLVGVMMLYSAFVSLLLLVWIWPA